MHYTLHQLQVFIKVVKTKSITLAAKELFLTQPGVSIQLKNLQDQFDIPLTEIVGRQLYITDFGYEIAHIAEEILRHVDAINYKKEAYKGVLSGRLKISTVSTGKYVMPYFLSDFLKLYPAVDLTMDVTNKALVIDSIENNEVDFGLVSVLPDQLKVDEEILMDNELYLIGLADWQMQPVLNQKEFIETLPMIYREKGSATRKIMENYLEQKKVNIQKKIVLTSNEAVKQAVIAGLGFSIMPYIGIRNEISTGELKIVHTKDFPIITQWRLIWPKKKQLNRVAQAYLDYIRVHKADIISKKFKK